MANKIDLDKENIINSFNELGKTSNMLFDYIGKIAYMYNGIELDDEFEEKYTNYRDLLSQAISKFNVISFIKSYKVLKKLLDSVIDYSKNTLSNNIDYKLYLSRINDLNNNINELFVKYNNSIDTYMNRKQGFFSKKQEKEQFDKIILK